jgi:hypothetical protein
VRVGDGSQVTADSMSNADVQKYLRLAARCAEEAEKATSRARLEWLRQGAEYAKLAHKADKQRIDAALALLESRGRISN